MVLIAEKAVPVESKTCRAGIDPFRRTATITMLHLTCCSVPRTLASLLVSWYTCLRGKTWLPSIMLKTC